MRTLCEVAVAYRPNLKAGKHPAIKCANDVVDLRWEIYSPDTIQYREEFHIVLLNRQGRVLGVSEISTGSSSCTIVDVKMILQRAILCNATSVILTHNHPSGGVMPSPQDDRLTRKIIDAAKLLDITIHDHIIMTEDDYYSYADHGRI